MCHFLVLFKKKNVYFARRQYSHDDNRRLSAHSDFSDHQVRNTKLVSAVFQYTATESHLCFVDTLEMLCPPTVKKYLTFSFIFLFFFFFFSPHGFRCFCFSFFLFLISFCLFLLFLFIFLLFLSLFPLLFDVLSVTVFVIRDRFVKKN